MRSGWTRTEVERDGVSIGGLCFGIRLMPSRSALVRGLSRPQAGTACPLRRSSFVSSVVDEAAPFRGGGANLYPCCLAVSSVWSMCSGWGGACMWESMCEWPNPYPQASHACNPFGAGLRRIPGRGWAACVSRSLHGLGHESVCMRGCQTLKPTLTESGVPSNPARTPFCASGTPLGVFPVGVRGQ